MKRPFRLPVTDLFSPSSKRNRIPHGFPSEPNIGNAHALYRLARWHPMERIESPETPNVDANDSKSLATVSCANSAMSFAASICGVGGGSGRGSYFFFRSPFNG